MILTVHTTLFIIGIALQIRGSIEQICPVESLNDTFVKYISCNYNNTYYYIESFEDSPTDTILFEITDPLWKLGSCDLVFGEGTLFGFVEVGDPEKPGEDELICNSFLIDRDGIEYIGNFVFLDVNEFFPEPVGIDPIESINIEEGTDGVLLEFSYTDKDFGETKSLTFEEIFDEESSTIFEIREVSSSDDLKEYELFAKEELDFETNNFFSLLVNFISVDERGTFKNTSQYFYIRVIDVSDNPPFFTNTPASVELEESDVVGRDVFQAHAQDGDFMVDNDIMYSIISGNDEGYFSIDNITGQVVTEKPIDREQLSQTLFALEVQAIEIEDPEVPPPDPTADNSATQVTNVIITDVNDQIPQFNVDNVEETVEEFGPYTGEVVLDVNITVTDMDEGSSGAYDLTSNNTDVKISPETGSGNTRVAVTLQRSDDFDYEIQGDAPVIILITATEIADPQHEDTLQLEITLVDINDNYPLFDSDNYRKTLEETNEIGYTVITITATDADVSSSYNADSIVYSISGCTEFDIDSTSGEITSVEPLDYESDNEISCTVTASDMFGISSESLESQTSLTVNVADVNDEPPEFLNYARVPIELPEDTDVGYLVSEVCIVDVDTSAELNVTLQFPNDPSNVVESWFVLLEVENEDCILSYHYFSGEIRVASPLDREYQDEVNIEIVAEDLNTEVNQAQTIESVKVNISDVNDEYPYFVDPENYSELDVKEEQAWGTLVIIIEADDDDLNDVLTYTVSDNTYLDIDNTGALYVNDKIDRETIAQFSLDVIVTDSVDHATSLTINVNVNDINDNSPILNGSICDTPYQVLENSQQGTFITRVQASDADQGVHQTITYQFNNQDYSNAPFDIDGDTGEITVFYDQGEELDREKETEWLLPVVAYDGCATSEVGCEIKTDTCEIYVTVLDENDNCPGPLDPNYVSSDESCQEGELVSDERLYSIDLDEENTNNSRVIFQAIMMWNSSGIEPVKMEEMIVEAASYNETVADINQYYCLLYALKNFTHLRGDYIVEIETEDYGNPLQSSTSNVSLEIKDYNDYYPVFYFDHCEDQTIVQRENDVEMVNEPLKCKDQTQALDIRLYDNDDEASNEVNLIINYAESTSNFGQGNQLYVFEVQKKSSDVFNIITTELLDRESGSEYNLTLEATDNGVPSLTSYSWVSVIVTDADEYPPVFCDVELVPCKDLLEIVENDPNGTFFQAAQDKDNTIIDDNNEPQIIGYRLLSEGPFQAFYIPNKTVNYIAPKDPLDRETQDVYSGIEIEAFPYDSTSSVEPTIASILNVIVTVLDVNDNWPYYPEEALYGDYLDTGNEGDRVAIVKFVDVDLNEVLTYDLLDDFVWSDGVSNYEDPFAIRQQAGNNSAEIYLNMDPEGTTGYCTFTVIAEDRDALHSNSTTVIVFVVTNDFIVSFYFENSLEQVRIRKDETESILSTAFRATCLIDAISTASDENNQEIISMTEVDAHFFREVEGKSSELELVTREEIERMASDSRTAKFLIESFNNIGLSLVSIGENQGVVEQNDDEDTIRALKITLGCVTLFLGLLLLLIILTNYVRNQKLKRELKVAQIPIPYETTNPAVTKGEYDIGTVGLPGAKMYGTGHYNPIYRNRMDLEQLHQRDKQSVSSGDSELVGVEDSPAFENFTVTLSEAQHGEESTDSTPHSREIKQNPLIEAKYENTLSKKNEASASRDPSGFAKSPDTITSEGSSVDGGSYSQNENADSNFSFGEAIEF